METARADSPGYLVCAFLIVAFSAWRSSSTTCSCAFGAAATVIAIAFLGVQVHLSRFKRAGPSPALPSLEHLRNKAAAARTGAWCDGRAAYACPIPHPVAPAVRSSAWTPTDGEANASAGCALVEKLLLRRNRSGRCTANVRPACAGLTTGERKPGTTDPYRP
jgi:hypothetical protein